MTREMVLKGPIGNQFQVSCEKGPVISGHHARDQGGEGTAGAVELTGMVRLLKPDFDTASEGMAVKIASATPGEFCDCKEAPVPSDATDQVESGFTVCS